MTKDQFVRMTNAGWDLLNFAAQVANNPRLQYETLPGSASNRKFIRFDGSLILSCDNTRFNVAKPLINAGLLEHFDTYYVRITDAGKEVLASRPTP